MTIVVYPTPATSILSLPLPANAAQETGGNLATAATLLLYLTRTVELNTLMLAELRAMRLQQSATYGVSIEPSHVIDDFSFN